MDSFIELFAVSPLVLVVLFFVAIHWREAGAY